MNHAKHKKTMPPADTDQFSSQSVTNQPGVESEIKEVTRRKEALNKVLGKLIEKINEPPDSKTVKKISKKK